MHTGIVIRARDEAASIGRLLDILARQTLPHDLVVVDSGSRDGTQDLVRERGARLVEIAPESFGFGRALNLGTREVAGDVVVSLSAHAFPRDDAWLERVTDRFGDETVACVFGEERNADGEPLAAPVRQDAAALRARPEWGYSNGAGGFRRSLWERRAFREDMPGTEDREWSLWALDQGHVCLLDPALAVDHDHARDSLRACFTRYEREARGFAMAFELPPYGAREAAREWWSDHGWHRSRVRARLDPRRVARLAGKWAGRR